MFAAAALLAPVSQVQAAELIGDTISCQETSPISTFTCDMSQAVVGNGVEFTVGTATPFISLDFGGNGLRIRNIFGSGFTLGQTIIRLENLSQIFQSVSIANENVGGFNANDVTLSNGVLTLDFRGTTWGANDIINLNLTAAAPAVPEPSTWMMLILGLGAIGASLRFQRRGKRVKGLDGALGLGRQLA